MRPYPFLPFRPYAIPPFRLSYGVRRIDLNADLGESYGRWRVGHDSELLTLVSSANVACGFHAGDPLTLRDTLTIAAANGVTVGAHPGYPDLLGFGRRDIDASPAEVESWVLYQIGALRALAGAARTEVRYVKPHGALYNKAARHPPTADAIAQGVHLAGGGLVLLGLPNTEILAAANRANVRSAREAFPDRSYEPDGTLTPRSRPDALVSDPDECADRAARMVLDGVVRARDGTMVEIEPDSLCVHGDGPEAVPVLRAIRQRLEQSGVTIAPFA